MYNVSVLPYISIFNIKISVPFTEVFILLVTQINLQLKNEKNVKTKGLNSSQNSISLHPRIPEISEN